MASAKALMLLVARNALDKAEEKHKTLFPHLWSQLDKLTPEALIELKNLITIDEATEDSSGFENAACENCGDPCDYHSELCLCEKCEKEAAST